jgi:hypothetical protein
MGDTKKHWKEIVEPDDLDIHMLEAGQAEVNAHLVKRMFSLYPLDVGSTLYVPGCGTGQMFDFITPSELGNLNYIFADIKPEFLKKLKTRLPNELDAKLLEDDIEQSGVKQKTDAALVVLLLQHIDWRRGLNNILATQPTKLFLIEQQQLAKDSEINKTRKLRPSMEKFVAVAKTELLNLLELENFLKQKGYQKQWTHTESVPHTKRMVGFIFSKTISP